MGLRPGVEQYPLSSVKGGKAKFFTPQSSDETMLVHIPPRTVDDLFVHHFQTDQLLPVKGTCILVILHNCQYQYLPMTELFPQVVRIPPGVPHGVIHLGSEDCVMVNALLRHGPPHERDYRPCPRPFPYDLVKAQQVLDELQINLAA